MEERSSLSGKYGFIIVAVGSAVGLGNIWRFQYLAKVYVAMVRYVAPVLMGLIVLVGIASNF